MLTRLCIGFGRYVDVVPAAAQLFRPPAPPPVEPGTADHHALFCAAAVARLSAELEGSGLDARTRAQLLDLRGLYHSWGGNTSAGIEDYRAICRVDVVAFPRAAALEALRAMPGVEIDALLARAAADGPEDAARWAELCAEAQSDEQQDPIRRGSCDESRERSGSNARLPEIGGVLQILDAMKRSHRSVDFATFVHIIRHHGLEMLAHCLLYMCEPAAGPR